MTLRILPLLAFLVACGEVPLAAAHTSIAGGCITAATYAAEKPAISDESLDSFEAMCNDQLETLERWRELEDAGTDASQ